MTVSMNSFLVRDTNLLSTHRTGLYSVLCSCSGSWAMTLKVVPLAETLVSTGTVTGTVTKLPPATRTPWPLASSSSFAVGIPLVSEMSGKTTVAEELRSSSIFPPARISSKRRSPAKLTGTQSRAVSTARPPQIRPHCANNSSRKCRPTRYHCVYNATCDKMANGFGASSPPMLKNENIGKCAKWPLLSRREWRCSM